MAANSTFRKALKRVLHPLMNERFYRYFQSVAMTLDIRRGRWHEPELDLLPLCVRAGETVVDMGANYGLYCTHLSKLVGPNGRVLAFEPVPYTSSVLGLIAKLQRWKNVTLFEKGVSDRNGTIEFELPLQDNGAPAAGLAHIGGRNNSRDGKEKQIRYGASRTVTCEVVRLDDVVPGSTEVSFIKCDVEGAELFAFRGAEQTILRSKPTVICEINAWYLEGFGVKLEELLGFFSEKGYALYWFDDKRRKLVERKAEDVTEDNYLFIHPERRDRFAAMLG